MENRAACKQGRAAAAHRQNHEENTHFRCKTNIFYCLLACVEFWDPTLLLEQLAQRPPGRYAPTPAQCQALIRKLYDVHQTHTYLKYDRERDVEFGKIVFALSQVYSHTQIDSEHQIDVLIPRLPLVLIVADINPLLFNRYSRNMQRIRNFLADKTVVRRNCCILLGSKYLPQLTQKLHRNVLPLIARVVWENRGVTPK
jgi:hypothetical protein